MTTLASAITPSVRDYQQTNQWLQDLARKAGAGKAPWPPKPSASNAMEVVNAFLSYQKVTAGVLEQFMDSYLQFEKTGRTFPTEHAMTKAIMADSASRAIPLPDRNMVAFVSTSRNAVSSDAIFLRMTLAALDSGVMGNPFDPGVTASIQTGQSRHQHVGVSAQAGIGGSFFSMFKASASTLAEMRNENDASRQRLTTGKAGIDSQDRQALTCLSAIYALEQSGILPQGGFMNTFVRLSEIAASKTGNMSEDTNTAKAMLTNPAQTLGVCNDAMRQNAQLRTFIMQFCTDHLRAALDGDPTGESAETGFWSEARTAIENRNITPATLKMMARYADHHDSPEPNMVVALLRMWDILFQTRKAASDFLMISVRANGDFDYAPQNGDVVTAFALSPVIGVDSAMMVLKNDRGGLSPRSILLAWATEIFPELTPLINDGDHKIIKNDQWDAALDAAQLINSQIMRATAHGEMTVLRKDVQNAGLTLVRENMPPASASLTLDGMSPWD